MMVKSWWKSWSLWAAAVGVALPEILQLIADNTSLLVFLPPEWHGVIRLVALILVLILRPIKQKNMGD